MNNNSLNSDTVTKDKSLLEIDMLTADEERHLSMLILSGEKAKGRLSDGCRLSVPEQMSLLEEIEKGEKAFERLVLANLPRATKTAAETYRKNLSGLNEFEDYKQTAMKVICKCAKTYDWKLGCRFGTYVHRCLIHEMMRENARIGYAIRIPEEYLPAINHLKDTAGAENSDRILKSADNSSRFISICSQAKSLQSAVSQENPEQELGDMIADPVAMTAEEIEDKIDLENQINKLRAALAGLSEEERVLLKGRMGFNGDPIPMRCFVGTIAKSISGVQKKQLAAEKHLREIYFNLPLAN